MKYCPSCGKENSEEAHFCCNCGYSFSMMQGGDAATPPADEAGHKTVRTDYGAQGNGAPAGGEQPYGNGHPYVAPAEFPAQGGEPNPHHDEKRPNRYLWPILGGIALIIVVLVVVVLNSGASYVNVSQNFVNMPQKGASASVSVETDGGGWNAACYATWITMHSDNDSVYFECEPNKTGQDRIDSICVTSGKITTAITIYQPCKATYINLSQTEASVGADGGEVTVDVDCDNDDWTISYPTYCTLEQRAVNQFTVIFPQNDDTGRGGSIVVSCDDQQKEVTFFQEGYGGGDE